MYTKSLRCILLLISLTLLSGCWSRKELNDLAIVMALGVDLDKDGYAVSAQVMNPGQSGSLSGGSNGSLPVVTYKAKGTTIPEALQRMLSTTPRSLYLAHVRVLVFGEAFARQGVGDAVDYITRNHELRTDFFLLVAKHTDASTILDVITPFEQIPANSLYSSILVAHKNWAGTGKVTLQQFIVELERGGSNPIMSGIQLQGDTSEHGSVKNVQSVIPRSLIKQAGIAVFKKDKLIGWLGEAPSKTVNYVLNEVESTQGSITCPDGGVAGFIITNAKSRIKISLNQKDEPEFVIHLKAEANLTALNSRLDLSQTASIRELEQRLEAKFDNLMAANIRQVQEKYDSDIYGLGEELHRQYPKLWRSYRKHWDETFRTVKVSVQSDVAIRRIGSVVQPQQKEMEEK
ncbi:Ger(x)C family spore germination protein [Paenibacillus sp. FSL R7-0331]|uniref:Ger(x)C family spore germination protein n=1 Tax=Paenibacillus sp. FSL R7-0331 TaxID=1536773 RepID=UPI0004F67EEE|nr:Ger(x)C family spore germination protein [Paenibacillus sp. FSL R7-0331]AIQ54451.1 spore gernimation protein GerC [Paenibacillus sp. FSL R7-0331]